MTDMERREAAIARLKEKRDFYTHLLTYFVVNTFLVVVWALSSGSGSYFWPVWSIAGWGIGVAIHAFETFRRPIGEDAIRRQMDRM